LCYRNGAIRREGKFLRFEKIFYREVFGWEISDYGPDCTSFEDGRRAIGFGKDRKVAQGGPLVVICHLDLAATDPRARSAGGKISKETL
jgi:predicted enzyme related to lactoylglutathione lyase